MANAFVSGLLAGYGLAIPVGAIGVLLLQLAARTRLAVGAAAALGVATVDGCYALVAAVGGTAVGTAVRPIATPLAIAAALVLLALAARILNSAHRAASREPAHVAVPSPGSTPPAWHTPARAYVALIGLTALNPATITYFVALVLGHNGPSDLAVDTGAAAGPAVVFALAAFAASASWQLMLATGGNALGRYISGPRGRLATAVVSALLITVLAIRTLVSV